MVEGWAPSAPRAAPRGPGPVLAPRAEPWRASGHVVGAADVPQSARTDALGRPSWTRLADGTERRERYHAGGGLAAIEVTTPDGAFTSTPIVDALTRDAHGRLAAARLGDACVVTWAYDRETGRLVAQDARRGARWYQGLRYTYDADGRITRALDLAQDGPGAIVPSAVSARRDHRYDVHGRLIEATGRTHRALSPKDPIPGSAGTIHGARPVSLNDGGALERYTQRFTYDPSGNLTSMQHVSMQSGGPSASWAQTWWVSSTSNRSLDAVDANGLPVLDPETRFDAAGQPVALSHLRALDWSWRGCLTRAVTIARADGPVDDGERYTYGADRVRVRKLSTRLVVGGADPVVETREVVYLGEQERVRVRRGDTLVLERWTTHVSDGERRVATLDRHVVDTLGAEVDALGPTQVRYHLTTPQGSTAVELAADGRLITYEEYLPHGGSAFLAGDDAREVSRRDVRYAGKERDRATGLHAYPQRYYAPWLGRWLTPDPIGPAGGLNLYEFVSGDPIGYVDPDGTDRRPTDEECRTQAQQATKSPAGTHFSLFGVVFAPGSSRPLSNSSLQGNAVEPSSDTSELVGSLPRPSVAGASATEARSFSEVMRSSPIDGSASGRSEPLAIGFLALRPEAPQLLNRPSAGPGSDSVPRFSRLPASALPAATAAAEAAGVGLGTTTLAAIQAGGPAVAIAGIGWWSFGRRSSIARYGNPWGMPSKCIGMPILCRQTTSDPLPVGSPTDAPTEPADPLAPAEPAPQQVPLPTQRPFPAPTPAQPEPAPQRPPARQSSPTNTPTAAPEPTATPSRQRPSRPRPALPTNPEPSERTTVNLDTGGIVGATSLRNPFSIVAINLFLLDKNAVVTPTALAEVRKGRPGPAEQVLLGLFLMRVSIVPERPSLRVLKVGNPEAHVADKQIFGTSDTLGVVTLTGDRKFLRVLAGNKIFLPYSLVDPPPRYSQR
jgi:RHS repeat-associated protein